MEKEKTFTGKKNPKEEPIFATRLEKAVQSCPPEPIRKELARMFRALGDGTRVSILLALREGEMCVRDLSIFLEISESAVSHQLRVLRDLYMVEPRRDGQLMLYSLRDSHVAQIIDLGLVHFMHETEELRQRKGMKK